LNIPFVKRGGGGGGNLGKGKKMTDRVRGGEERRGRKKKRE